MSRKDVLKGVGGTEAQNLLQEPRNELSSPMVLPDDATSFRKRTDFIILDILYKRCIISGASFLTLLSYKSKSHTGASVW